MARKMVDEGADLYRVVVTSKKRTLNPDYDWRAHRDSPNSVRFLVSETERVTEYFGPYNSLPAAKGQRKQKVFDAYGDLREHIVGADIEKANIVWEVVE